MEYFHEIYDQIHHDNLFDHLKSANQVQDKQMQADLHVFASLRCWRRT